MGQILFHSKILYKIYSMHLNTRQDHTACTTDLGVSSIHSGESGVIHWIVSQEVSLYHQSVVGQEMKSEQVLISLILDSSLVLRM